MTKKRKVAIFDIDGTIFRSSLLIELVDTFIIQGIFPKKAARLYERPHKEWMDRKENYGGYIHGVIKAFDKYVRGVSRKDLIKVAKKVASLHKDRVYRYTRDLVRELKKKNYYLLAISHSPKYITQEFGKKLGFDKIYGRLFEVDQDNRFTGALLYPDLIEDKAKILMRAVEKANLTLKNSVGVGDTETDISFLELVDRPICFNPNSRLYGVAKKRGWSIVVERKDVVYHL